MREFVGYGWILFLLVFTTACKHTSTSDSAASAKDSLTVSASTRVNYLDECQRLRLEAFRQDSVMLTQTEVVDASANLAIKAFADFAQYCVSDSLSPVFLLKIAQIARAINNIPQAKLALERCIDTYPEFKNRSAALFLLGQLYDEPNYLNDEHRARQLYQQVMNDYPGSDWAQNAQAAIQLLGKTDKEIIQEFTKKNRK